MHGPPPSWFDGPMLWPAWPRIPVLDTVAPTLRLNKALKWRANRSAALADWGAAGIFFDVFEEHPRGHTTWNPNYADEETELRRHIVPGTLRLMRGTYSSTLAGTSWSYPIPPGSVVMIALGVTWWQAYSPWFRQFVVTHETGHALGLNHRTDLSSVMFWEGRRGDGTTEPDDHDLDALEAYFGD